MGSLLGSLFLIVQKNKQIQEPNFEIEERARTLKGWHQNLVVITAASWSIFQLWHASPLPFLFEVGVFIDVPARGIHLSFALMLCFFLFPLSRSRRRNNFSFSDFILGISGGFCAFYLNIAYHGIVERNGILLELPLSLFGYTFSFPLELLLASFGILTLLEATRRAIGKPLVIVASAFLLYSYFGQTMPDVIAHQGLSFKRLIGYQWLTGEAIFGIPISVSVNFVFLFVLFGALLEKAGGGQYFLNLAVALVGRFRGGPAKAAILSSGLTGMISGSSIANVVTTGTFTIPTMKRTGFSAVKAGAIEVAASVNGQIMPPIMGAAAFIIAEMLGITYFQVITHAFIPAIITYLALFFIAHIEAQKHGLMRMEESKIPPIWPTFISGIHYLIPIAVLVYLLIIERWTAGSAVFFSILTLAILIIGQRISQRRLGDINDIVLGFWEGCTDVFSGLVRGAVNMIPVSIAIACAGIIVGAVASSGLSNAMVEVVEIVSGGNFYVLLFMVMALCLILGLGLPTTANYLVVAALLANVIVEIGSSAGFFLPLIAVHLYVFYFGLMADVTPPVGLAAYAASGISRADPISTGIQAFWYEIRTAILPLVFIFNPELLLIGVTSFWHGLFIFIISLIAIICFTAATQGWFLTRAKWHEIIGLLLVTVALFRPDSVVNIISPSFSTLDPKVAIEHQKNQVQSIRVHITRNTNYGDRYKLFEFKLGSSTRTNVSEYLGVTLKPSRDKYVVDQFVANSFAENKGIELQDKITKIEIKNLDQLNRSWGYVVGIIVLILVLVSQWQRAKKIKAPL